MSRFSGWLLCAAPLGAGAIVAGALMLAGDSRALQVSMRMPLLPLLGGAALSAVVFAVVRVRQQRRHDRLRADAAVVAARHDAAAEERQQHRRFLARLDHELKNPIMAIRAQAAANGRSADWRAVDTQAMRLGNLVRDLRKLSELETRELECEALDLEELITESVDALGQHDPTTAARFALMITRVPWPVPSVLGDVDLLSLALDNIVGNAVKYSDAGPIDVRLREQDGWAVIEVADSGRGIPDADIPHVLNELARAENARDVAGSGIGLTLASIVVRRHGGEVQVRSRLDEGTVVTIRLPGVRAA